MNSTVLSCEPNTYILPKNFTQSREAYNHIRAAVYIVETDESKNPSERYLGSRQMFPGDKGKFRINPESVMKHGNKYDGHINRNIRLALSLIDQSKPYIEVVSFNQSKESDALTVTWKVNGCKTLNEARVIVNGGTPKSVLPDG